MRVHDLLRLDAAAVQELSAAAGAPAWVAESLTLAPWVVVRRAAGREVTPVGVRGPERHQRWAGNLTAQAAEVRSPADLRPRDAPRPELAPVAALDLVLRAWDMAGASVGPGGSCGFEIATGASVMRPGSDLDLVVTATRRLTPAEVRRIGDIAESAGREATCRVDVLVETPRGGVHLVELATGSVPVVLRTSSGPELVDDPWLGAS